MQLKNIELFTRLTKKNKLWRQQKEQKTLFKELKELFTVKPILKIYIPSLPIVVETDVLDFILGVYLVQKYLDGWYLVIYYGPYKQDSISTIRRFVLVQDQCIRYGTNRTSKTME